ncbi:MAG: ATP-binding protein [Gammaproteobacteria bacterium]
MEYTQLKSNNAKLDIVVHVDEFLDEQSRQRVEHAMIKAAGVERARFNKERQHLLLIGYDPAQTSSTKILKLVKQQQLSAQLIGGL